MWPPSEGGGLAWGSGALWQCLRGCFVLVGWLLGGVVLLGLWRLGLSCPCFLVCWGVRGSVGALVVSVRRGACGFLCAFFFPGLLGAGGARCWCGGGAGWPCEGLGLLWLLLALVVVGWLFPLLAVVLVCWGAAAVVGVLRGLCGVAALLVFVRFFFGCLVSGFCQLVPLWTLGSLGRGAFCLVQVGSFRLLRVVIDPLL